MKLGKICFWGGLLLALATGRAYSQDIDAGARKAEVCMPCHGVNGNSTNQQFPILAGQTLRYIYVELKDFKAGRRKNPFMDPVAAKLSREDMFDLGAFFAAQKRAPTPFNSDPVKAAKGEAKADETLCTMCHLGGFMGQNEVPRVAGQHYEYIVKQLEDFKAGRRTNDAGTMASVAKTLSEEDIKNLANYLAGLQ